MENYYNPVTVHLLLIESLDIIDKVQNVEAISISTIWQKIKQNHIYKN